MDNLSHLLYNCILFFYLYSLVVLVLVRIFILIHAFWCFWLYCSVLFRLGNDVILRHFHVIPNSLLCNFIITGFVMQFIIFLLLSLLFLSMLWILLSLHGVCYLLIFLNCSFSSIDFSPLFSNNYPRFFKTNFQFSINFKNFNHIFLYAKFNLLQRLLMSLLPKIC